ncbi:radical SAM protein [Thermoanaerobacterium thermosaccharolyticum]|uniref:FeMo cofactor biosynthesis protein NifB n=1 Tax=Thermoanaerobacterium thermosaccharolyticum M0795 TaxID=698948 RepID=L0ILU5_THETR|nr:radical SAM protein [Thermoanaerobacterium thermosaccharolyticum]AGB19216.1 putative Fe-S oxidoreductase [Thermoanaerobacterium thermosaccharolyticum M0795]
MSFIREVNSKCDSFEHLIIKHPCLSRDAHFNYGRIHLPVSPACNIHCKFCTRGLNKTENKPGNARKVLTPEEAVDVLDKALELCPEITVVGIAGPGDTLATDHALRTFELIHKKYPDLIKCLSTNGLLLKEYAEKIVSVGVKTVTVTVNAVDVDILEKICSYVRYNGKYMVGKEAASWLILAQLAGIRKISEMGVVVKVNTVLVPGINDFHVEKIAKVTKKAGASIINLIPLIPQGAMKDIAPPSCIELNKARENVEKHLQVFRHCTHCRADACGIPGKGYDISSLLYDNFQLEETFSHG